MMRCCRPGTSICSPRGWCSAVRASMEMIFLSMAIAEQRKADVSLREHFGELGAPSCSSPQS